MRVLIAGTDSVLVQEIPKALQREGHRVYVHALANGLPDLVLAEGIHLAILEVALATLGQALGLCHTIHEQSSALILALTRLTSVAERVSLLEAGADDCLSKPFDRRELLARVRALLCRHPLSLPGRGSRLIQVTDQWMLDLAGQRLVAEDQEIALSAREFHLLAHMVRHEGVALSREALIASLWGPGYEGSTREIDVYVCYLRRKLEPEPNKPRYITTAWGVGYRYVGPGTGQRRAACS